MQKQCAGRFLGISLFALVLLGLQVGVFSGLTLGTAPPAAAEEGEEAAAADEGGGEAKTEGADSGPKSESMLVWLYNSLKLRYVIIFLFLTFNLVALWVMNVLAVRRETVIPAVLLQTFEGHLNEKRYQEAYELAKNDESFLGKVLAAGMQQLSSGYDAAVQAMQEVGEEENMKMEHRLGYVALIAQIAPMFGLLGTVDGMVQAFDTIAKLNTSPRPAQLAGGIGTALVTTLVGLWIAIPSLVYYQFVRNRINRLVMEVGVVSGELMKRFSTVGGGAAAGAGAKKS